MDKLATHVFALVLIWGATALVVTSIALILYIKLDD